MAKTIKIRVVPKAKKNDIRKFADGYKVYLTAPPADGKANKALLKALAGYFGVKKSHLSIVKGEKARDKVVRVG